MLQMRPKHSRKSCFRDSVKALEADIQHANSLAASLPTDYAGNWVQMKLCYSPFAPFLVYLIEWMDYSCTDSLPNHLGLLNVFVYKVYVDGMPSMSPNERKASVREFYAVLYPLLRQLEEELVESNTRDHNKEVSSRKQDEERRALTKKELERDDECAICMENCTKMVLPDCGHSMCVTCFHEWYVRSQSCPFCRGSLQRVDSGDLWVLTGYNDLIDSIALAYDNLKRFYLYIENLPFVIPETPSFLLLDYMI